MKMSFLENKRYVKNNDNYTDTYRRRDAKRCEDCACCGETDARYYVCAKNPYNLLEVLYRGHCDGFTRIRPDFNILQRLVLRLNNFKFRDEKTK